jgi:predicted nucleotidyltransferase
MTIRSISIPDQKLQTLCRKWRIRRISLFGSALSGAIGEDSDIDLLVEFDTEEKWSLMDLVRAEDEFAGLMGRRVDLVDRKNLERSSNWIRRNAILKSAEVIYAA